MHIRCLQSWASGSGVHTMFGELSKQEWRACDAWRVEQAGMAYILCLKSYVNKNNFKNVPQKLCKQFLPTKNWQKDILVGKNECFRTENFNLGS